jgi:hypothetical protein
MSDEIIGLDCDMFRHIFHWECILNWFKKKRSCPLCRKNFYYLLPRTIFYHKNTDMPTDQLECTKFIMEVNENIALLENNGIIID